MESRPPVVDLRGVRKTYRLGGEDVHALRDVDLQIVAGEYVAIVGPSGSGKSTLLNLIGCLDTPTAGEYFLDGIATHTLSDSDLARVRNARLGFVFQSFNLLPRMTALRNVALPLAYADMDRSDRMKRAEEALARVGLTARRHHRPAELSGGERQRVAIARALVNKPSVLLADEPTGNLDQRVGGDIVQLIETLHREAGLTVLMVTHDPALAARCRRLVRIVDGRIVEDRVAA